MRQAWKVVALALVWLFASSAAAQDKPIELRFSGWVGIVHADHTGVMVPWAKMIEEKSGDPLKVTINPGWIVARINDVRPGSGGPLRGCLP